MEVVLEPLYKYSNHQSQGWYLMPLEHFLVSPSTRFTSVRLQMLELALSPSLFMRLNRQALGLRLIIGAQTIMVPNVYDPSELRSDVNGKVVRYLHEEGTEIAKGETFVVAWAQRSEGSRGVLESLEIHMAENSSKSKLTSPLGNFQ